MEQSPSWEAKQSLQLVKKFPAFYITRCFITRQRSLSWARAIQSTSYYLNSWRSVLILSFHLRLGLPSCLFSSRFQIKTLYTPLPTPIRATCPAYLILPDLITRITFREEYRSFSSSLWSFLHSPYISFLLGPNTLNTLFSNTLSLRSSLNVSDQVLHLYKTTGKIIILCILIFIFLDRKLVDKIFFTERHIYSSKFCAHFSRLHCVPQVSSSLVFWICSRLEYNGNCEASLY
jgi:hypothetical protein